MEIAKLINTSITNKNGEIHKILSIDESNDLKEVRLKLDNGKLFNLYVSYKSGFIRFNDDEFNKEMDEFLKKEVEDEKIKLQERELERKREGDFETKNYIGIVDKFREDYYFLSNFYECNVTYQGITYSNNEAAFQAQKDLSRRNEFVDLKPAKARALGRKVSLRKDWNLVKLSIMEELLRCKFDQNPDLKEKLIKTDRMLLIEKNRWNDRFWGVSRGSGENNLGKLLMKLREEYQKEKENNKD